MDTLVSCCPLSLSNSDSTERMYVVMSSLCLTVHFYFIPFFPINPSPDSKYVKTTFV